MVVMVCNQSIVSLNSAHDEVYWIQHYLIKFVNDFQQAGYLH